MDYDEETTFSEGDSGCCSSDGQFRRRSSTVTGLSGSTGFLTSPPSTAPTGVRPPRRKRRPSYSKAIGTLATSPSTGQFETTSVESMQVVPCRNEDYYHESEPQGGSGPIIGQAPSPTAVSFYDRITENVPSSVRSSLPSLYNRNVFDRSHRVSYFFNCTEHFIIV